MHCTVCCKALKQLMLMQRVDVLMTSTEYEDEERNNEVNTRCGAYTRKLEHSGA